MAEYITRQKKTLLDFLTRNSDSSYTAEELTEEIRQKSTNGHAVGKSTVYRLMTRFVEEGRVKRFARGHSRRFVYQIVKGEDCKFHLQMRCTGCGRLFHLDGGFSHELRESIRKREGFSLSECDNVLLGICADCKKKQNSFLKGSL